MLRDNQTDFTWSGRRKVRLPGKSLIMPFLLVGLGIWLGRAYFSNAPIEDLVSINLESKPLPKSEPLPKLAEPLKVPSSPSVSKPQPPPPVSKPPLLIAPISEPPLPTEVLNVPRPQTVQVHKPNVAVKKPAPSLARDAERARDYRALREELLSRSN